MKSPQLETFNRADGRTGYRVYASKYPAKGRIYLGSTDSQDGVQVIWQKYVTTGEKSVRSHAERRNTRKCWIQVREWPIGKGYELYGRQAGEMKVEYIGSGSSRSEAERIRDRFLATGEKLERRRTAPETSRTPRRTSNRKPAPSTFTTAKQETDRIAALKAMWNRVQAA